MPLLWSWGRVMKKVGNLVQLSCAALLCNAETSLLLYVEIIFRKSGRKNSKDLPNKDDLSVGTLGREVQTQLTP
jgi:hypothetical protein